MPPNQRSFIYCNGLKPLIEGLFNAFKRRLKSLWFGGLFRALEGLFEGLGRPSEAFELKAL